MPPFAATNVPAKVTAPCVADAGVRPVVPPLKLVTPLLPATEIVHDDLGVDPLNTVEFITSVVPVNEVIVPCTKSDGLTVDATTICVPTVNATSAALRLVVKVFVPVPGVTVEELVSPP